MDYTGTQIGKYKILRLIGEGGMASVYEGEHEKLGTKAAIKVLNPILSTNKQIHERFANEAKLMASLNHRNITKVIDYEETDTTMAIVMEFLEGEDLSDYIRRKGRVSDEECKGLFAQILPAFGYAHKQGIIHRDIKPSNIYILKDGTVKILDFGIAKIFGEGNEMTQTGTQIGTPVYMSPEQVRAEKDIDKRSDIYSLGVTLYYALNGTPPYDGNTTSQFVIQTKIVNDPLPELSVSSTMKTLVDKACQKDRALRFQNCDEWLEALNSGKAPAKADANKTSVDLKASDRTIVEVAAAEDILGILKTIKLGKAPAKADANKTSVDLKASDRTIFESPVIDKTVVETKTENRTVLTSRNKENLKNIQMKRRRNLVLGILVLGIIVVVLVLIWENLNNGVKNELFETEQERIEELYQLEYAIDCGCLPDWIEGPIITKHNGRDVIKSNPLDGGQKFEYVWYANLTAENLITGRKAFWTCEGINDQFVKNGGNSSNTR